uniref:BRCT domain-containing protein n=1 Tax=Setaria digitata TaxID=48799 RepID=A0A915PWJ6_9BILA
METWTCINEICDGKCFPLCPQCLLPVGLQHVRPATFAEQLFQSLLLLKKNLAELTVSQLDRQVMLSLIETKDQQRRTVEDFCSTQENVLNNDNRSNCASINTQADELSSKRVFKPSIPAVSSGSLNLISVQDSIKPLSEGKKTGTAGDTSFQSDFQLIEQLDISNEPKKFQFFKEPPKNTFGRTVARKRVTNEWKHESVNGKAKNSSISPLTAAKNSHKSPSQRYECNLVNAAIRGSKKKLLEALENGEDSNERDNLGLTALYHAAAHNYTEICKILIENGALINAHGGELCDTALHAAVQWHATDAVGYLLSKGANRRALYPSQKLKRYSVFLSMTIPAAKLERGRRFFSELSKDATNFEAATHLVVHSTKDKATEVTVEILEAMLYGQYILTSEWLDACLETNSIVDEQSYEVTTINRNGQLLAQNSCTIARKNYARMDYEIKKLIQLAGGVILGREPKPEIYIESGLRPYHAPTVENSSNELSGLFAVYMPGQSMPVRVVKQKFINLVTPIWIMDCIAKFTLLRPEDR